MSEKEDEDPNRSDFCSTPKSQKGLITKEIKNTIKAIST